ncbi:hypothetical protein [Streptomyces violascens]|uniref:hypothetical protein n=1 Tax=Streptomyces violascens TaxID=67381 RepID=UPI001985068C|nr:hypothetical protein [Streptomyces violascens]GGU52492.1 hypothetical protein GCM10010289_85850 [Streptomyces violascens]
MSLNAPRPSGPRPAGDPPRPYTPLWRRLREDEWPPLGEVLRGRREQVHPGVVLVLFFPCLWWLTIPLLVGYQLARTARRMARRVFPMCPEGRVEDPEVLRVQRVRAWAALAMAGVLVAVFGGWQDVAEVPGRFLQRLLFAPWLALLSAAVVVALLFWAAEPGARRTMRTQLWPAGRSALCYFGAWTLVPLLFLAAAEGMGLLQGGTNVLLWVSVMFVCWAPFWWVIFFLCFASGPALRHAFNLSALHAALPALVTAVLVWMFALLGLSAGGLPPGPVPLAVCAFLGGPVSVTVVAWWEIHRLRRRHGVRWRG